MDKVKVKWILNNKNDSDSEFVYDYSDGYGFGCGDDCNIGFGKNSEFYSCQGKVNG